MVGNSRAINNVKSNVSQKLQTSKITNVVTNVIKKSTNPAKVSFTA